MKGRDKCEFLRSIRKEIAEKNGIEYNPKPCTHEGDCLGVCPACEHEAEYIMDELRRMKVDGKDIDVTTERLIALDRDISTREVDNEDEEEDMCTMGIPLLTEEEEVLMGEPCIEMGLPQPDNSDEEDHLLMGDIMPPESHEEDNNSKRED